MTTETGHGSSAAEASIGSKEISSAMRLPSVGCSQNFLLAPGGLVGGKPVPGLTQSRCERRPHDVSERIARLGNVAPGRINLPLTRLLMFDIQPAAGRAGKGLDKFDDRGRPAR